MYRIVQHKTYSLKRFMLFCSLRLYITMIVIILIVLTFILAYIKIQSIYNYWKNKKIPYVKPWPFFGNMATVIFQRKTVHHQIQDLYKAASNGRYIGIYQFLRPTLLIRDPNLIKQICIKEFDVFPDHRKLTSAADPVGDRNLFALSSSEGWHSMRSTISPAFTSSKMKLIYGFMDECANQFVNYFKAQGKTAIFETKDAFSRFANDAIGSTVFGVNYNSLVNKENEFYLNAKNLTNFNGIRVMRFFINTISPTIAKFLRITFLNKKSCDFYTHIVKETLRIREEKQIVRHDMIHLLNEARKGHLKHEQQNETIDNGFAVAQESEIDKSQKRKKVEVTEEDIIAHAVSFYSAGFENISTLLSFIAYELAVNKDIQDKLKQEIDLTLEENNGKMTYELLLRMPYLDCVVSEALRKWSGTFTDRLSVKDFIIESENPDETALLLDKGTTVLIPIYAIHRDPDYYPDPDRFDPDRFSKENKLNIKPFTYFPFGVGPRNCIGSRFVLLETKVIIVKILENFEVVPVAQTKIPLVPSKSRIDNLPDGGVWLGLKPRGSF